MSVSPITENLDTNYEEDLSKDLEKICKVPKETKLSLEKKSDSDSDSSPIEESDRDSDTSSDKETEFSSNLLVKLITEQKTKEKNKNMWDNSPYKDLPKLQSNNVGVVGENFIYFICNKTNIPVCIDGSKTKEKGGGRGDGKIKEKYIEIKTSHLGLSGSFQHELGETPWKTEYMIFLDIAPNFCYITIFPSFTENKYKKCVKCIPYFPSRSFCWRKKSGAFKFDTTPKLNDQSIDKGNTIKITDKTTYKQIGKFIDNLIK